MPALKTSGLAVLIFAGFFCASSAMAQTASENAVQAAMDACEQEKEMQDARTVCQLHVLAMQHSMKSAIDGLEGAIHFDFNEANDSEAQKAAKQALYTALNNCETSGDSGNQITQCHMEAFDQYQQAMGQ